MSQCQKVIHIYDKDKLNPFQCSVLKCSETNKILGSAQKLKDPSPTKKNSLLSQSAICWLQTLVGNID